MLHAPWFGKKRVQGGFSVDEGFAVSSWLLDLVVVLCDDVKKHSLWAEIEIGRRRKRKTSSVETRRKMGRAGAEGGGGGNKNKSGK